MRKDNHREGGPIISRRTALQAIGTGLASMIPEVAFLQGAQEEKQRGAQPELGKFSSGLGKVQPQRGRGPNILMIMADQHRSDWIGCTGSHWVRTPNIDSIAARGVRFTRAACNSPVCAPSRAALASGLRCSRVNVLSNNDLYPFLSVPTYYQALRAAGYRVGCVGKTDLHKSDHWEGRHGDRPIMYRLGFTDPFETEGKESAANFGKGPHCPYQ